MKLKYNGYTVDFYIPNIGNYSFHNLLVESCEIFGLDNPKDYIITDELNNIFPLYPSLKSFVLESKK